MIPLQLAAQAHRQRTGRPVEAVPLRLIGLELRIRDSYTPSGTEELQMVPLDVEIPAELRMPYSSGRFLMPCTLHTSEGDINFEIVISR